MDDAMAMARQVGRLDWLVELGGASTLAACAAYAALKLAPSFAWSAPTATAAAGFGFFALGMLVMRAAAAGSAEHELAEFAVERIEADELLLDTPVEEPLLLEDIVEEPLLLDTPIEEPLLLENMVEEHLLLDTPVEKSAEDDVLLLDDALPQPAPTSRVVQLFAASPIPTPGQLKERIDQHLADTSRPVMPATQPPQPDASAALYAALNELRRSLR